MLVSLFLLVSAEFHEKCVAECFTPSRVSVSIKINDCKSACEKRGMRTRVDSSVAISCFKVHGQAVCTCSHETNGHENSCCLTRTADFSSRFFLHRYQLEGQRKREIARSWETSSGLGEEVGDDSPMSMVLRDLGEHILDYQQLPLEQPFLTGTDRCDFHYSPQRIGTRFLGMSQNLRAN